MSNLWWIANLLWVSVVTICDKRNDCHYYISWWKHRNPSLSVVDTVRGMLLPLVSHPLIPSYTHCYAKGAPHPFFYTPSFKNIGSALHYTGPEDIGKWFPFRSEVKNVDTLWMHVFGATCGCTCLVPHLDARVWCRMWCMCVYLSMRSNDF